MGRDEKALLSLIVMGILLKAEGNGFNAADSA